MDTNNITSKVISLIVPIILLLVVLVPITESMTNNGGSGNSSEMYALYPMDVLGEVSDVPDYFLEDNHGIGDGANYNVIYAPSIDGRTYSDNELIATFETMMVVYKNGKFHVNDIDNDLEGDFGAILFGCTISSNNTEFFYAVYNSINDIPTGIISANDMGVLPVDGGTMVLYEGNRPAMNCTNNKNITISTESYKNWLINNPHMGGLGVGYVVDASELGILMAIDSSILIDGAESEGLFEDTREFANLVMNNGENLDIPKLLEHGSEPITLDKWKGWQAILPNGVQFEYKPQYLLFYNDMEYTGGSEGNSGSDNGMINALIKLVPIFVALGILMALAVPIITSRNQRY